MEQHSDEKKSELKQDNTRTQQGDTVNGYIVEEIVEQGNSWLEISFEEEKQYLEKINKMAEQASVETSKTESSSSTTEVHKKEHVEKKVEVTEEVITTEVPVETTIERREVVTYVTEQEASTAQQSHCEHMQQFLTEIRECNESLERSIAHLTTMPNDEALKHFIVNKQQELKEFNAENCTNIQLLVREMMTSNQMLIQKFNDSMRYMMTEMNSRKSAECGGVVGYVTTEEFIPAERRVQHAQNTQQVMRQMQDENESLIQHCKDCVPVPCTSSLKFMQEQEAASLAAPVVIATLVPQPMMEIITAPEQVYTHEERIKQRLHRKSRGEDDFVFQTVYKPCPARKISYYMFS